MATLRDISDKIYPDGRLITLNVAQAIEDRGTNAHALAIHIGMKPPNIYRILNDENYDGVRFFQLDQLMKIADSLGIPLARLLKA